MGGSKAHLSFLNKPLRWFLLLKKTSLGVSSALGGRL